MFRVILSSFLLCILSITGKANVPDSTEIVLPIAEPRPDIFETLREQNAPQGVVTFLNGETVNELVNLHIRINELQKNVTGYRIQIFSGSSYNYTVEQVEEMKAAFVELFPDIPVYLDYFEPDFKIRVGNFRNKLECYPIVKRIQRKYPNQYIVKTAIPFSDLMELSFPKKEEENENEENNPETNLQYFIR